MYGASAACIAAAAAAAMAALAAAAPASGSVDAAAPPPLRQVEAGAETGEILCNGDRILLISPGGAPACVFYRSLDALAGRGWQEEASGYGGKGAPHAPADPTPPCDPGRGPAAQGGAPSAPRLPDIHRNALSISRHPVVGETAEIVFTVVHGSYPHQAVFSPARLAVGIGTGSDPPAYRVFDVVSNIGTGDPGVFRPYDPANATEAARPGGSYTVKAKFEVLEEGVVSVYGLGIDGDYRRIYLAVSENMSMTLDEYHATGQTYLGRMAPPRDPCIA